VKDAAMNYRATAQKIADYRGQITDLRRKMREAQAAIEPEQVEDYVFKGGDGTVKLSALFGGKDTLLVIHNMGRSCALCTLWADGFNGVYEHLASRAAFVVSSPDPPDVQREFAASRGWRFPMVSIAGAPRFAQDMGYWTNGPQPGVSVFKRSGGKILRVADTAFSPGDDFCAVWHFFELIPEGPAGWSPKVQY
jgi:predicted dithiol-disulfide oxidoreductase (DUF899 family)